MTRPVVLIAAAFALTAAAAQAQDVHISTAKLDLNNAHDAKVLYQRLVSAAAEVCGGYPKTIGEMGLFERCYRPTLDAAVAQANAPLVSAVAGRDSVMRLASR